MASLCGFNCRYDLTVPSQLSIFFLTCFLGLETKSEIDELVNTSPNNRLLDWPKFKAFADDSLNVSHMMEFVFRWV